jgi:uncharacterized membrane protein
MSVIRTILWLVASSLLAVIIHIAYVLFVPQYEMGRLIGQAVEAAAGVNSFVVLEPAQQELILRENSRSGVAGLCPFDLSEGTLVFDAALPDAIWSFALYSENGKDTYAINKAQAGTSRFRLTVKPSPGLIGLLRGVTGDQGGAVDDGWTVTTPSERGIAVVWVALDDRSLRKTYADVMKRSTCRVMKPESEVGSQKSEI